jgi:hypothetical protein
MPAEPQFLRPAIFSSCFELLGPWFRTHGVLRDQILGRLSRRRARNSRSLPAWTIAHTQGWYLERALLTWPLWPGIPTAR